MKTPITVALIACAAGLSFVTKADERPDHYEGEPSETLEQALTNFSGTNARIAKILAHDEVTLNDLAKIHEMTYTLENALERIDDEYAALQEQLEQFHLASEGTDVEHARGLGQTYLENAHRFPGVMQKQN